MKQVQDGDRNARPNITSWGQALFEDEEVTEEDGVDF